MQDPKTASSEVEEAVTRLREALATIRFGSVEFIIHEGRVLQIDRKEKLRLDHPRRGDGALVR